MFNASTQQTNLRVSKYFSIPLAERIAVEFACKKLTPESELILWHLSCYMVFFYNMH